MAIWFRYLDQALYYKIYSYSKLSENNTISHKKRRKTFKNSCVKLPRISRNSSFGYDLLTKCFQKLQKSAEYSTDDVESNKIEWTKKQLRFSRINLPLSRPLRSNYSWDLFWRLIPEIYTGYSEYRILLICKSASTVQNCTWT